MTCLRNLQTCAILGVICNSALSTELPSKSRDVESLPHSSSEDITVNNTRCSQTQLSFTRETLLHIWEIKGLLGYVSYIKRFDQPFELKTEHISFKSDKVDGNWMFKVHRIRHLHYPAQSQQSSGSHNDISDLRVVAIYSYEAKQQRKIDFLIQLTLIHGNKEIVLPPQRSTSPTIVQQRFYNNRGYQINTNFLEYVYTFTWTDVIHPVENIKSNAFHQKYHPDSITQSEATNNPDASEEFLEEITRTDFAGHFGDVMLKFIISAYFPGDPVSVTSSRCNSSIFEHVSPTILQKLVSPSSGSHSVPNFYKDNSQKILGNPPYLRYSNSMLHDDRFVDVMLVIGDEEIPAHRIILATSSPVFSAILENATMFLTSNQSSIINSGQLPRLHIEPRDINVQSFQEFLRYVYTGAVDNSKLSNELLSPGIMIAADSYDVPELKRHCETSLLLGLRAENAVEMYTLGSRVNSSRLVRKALSVMKMNKAILASQTEDFRQLSLSHPKLMHELFLAD